MLHSLRLQHWIRQFKIQLSTSQNLSHGSASAGASRRLAAPTALPPGRCRWAACPARTCVWNASLGTTVPDCARTDIGAKDARPPALRDLWESGSDLRSGAARRALPDSDRANVAEPQRRWTSPGRPRHYGPAASAALLAPGSRRSCFSGARSGPPPPACAMRAATRSPSLSAGLIATSESSSGPWTVGWPGRLRAGKRHHEIISRLHPKSSERCCARSHAREALNASFHKRSQFLFCSDTSFFVQKFCCNSQPKAAILHRDPK